MNSLKNNDLVLNLTNKGGEMSSLTYDGLDILYKGDGPYWSGKNPTLFPFISSPDAKKYTYNNITYPCRNHGLIRYSDLETVVDDGNIVKMRLVSNEDTLKEYPFNFEYNITYKLEDKKVLIDYDITNKDDKTMPFTFGLHPGFLVEDINNIKLVFPDDEQGTLFNQVDRTTSTIKLGEYTNFLKDLEVCKTVILESLKSKYVILKMNKYSIKLDISNFKYLALWSPDPKANFICIEPWLSINNIKPSNNPFDPSFELEYLKPSETFKINYSFEII